MTAVNEIKSRLQQEAISAWKGSDHIGLVKAATGFGKTRAMALAIKYLQEMNSEANIYIMTSSSYLRDTGLPEELAIWGVDPDTVNILCHRSSHKVIDQTIDLLIIDEYDEFLTARNVVIFQKNRVHKILALTASMGFKKVKLLSELGIFIPEVYKLTLTRSQQLGIINPIRIKVYDVPLDEKPNFNKRSLNSENSVYTFLQKKIDGFNNRLDEVYALISENRAKFLSVKSLLEERDKLVKSKRWFESRGSVNRTKLLWNLESNLDKCKSLRDNLLKVEDNKVLMFSQRTEILDKLSDNTYYGDTKNNNNIELFNEGTIRDLAATPKKVGRGISFVGLNNAVGHSFTSSSADFIQALMGRLSRLPVDRTGTLYLFTNYYHKMVSSNKRKTIPCVNHIWLQRCISDIEAQGENFNIEWKHVTKERLYQNSQKQQAS